jgi:hypothetical protein
MNRNENNYCSPPFGNPEVDGASKILSVDDSDYDNYWNKEGVFEYESDKSDENLNEIDNFDEKGYAKLVSDRDEAYQQQQEESYQHWAMEEEQKNEDMEEAIEQFHRSRKER